MKRSSTLQRELSAPDPPGDPQGGGSKDSRSQGSQGETGTDSKKPSGFA